jgi:hypothetical protein
VPGLPSCKVPNACCLSGQSLLGWLHRPGVDSQLPLLFLFFSSRASVVGTREQPLGAVWTRGMGSLDVVSDGKRAQLSPVGFCDRVPRKVCGTGRNLVLTVYYEVKMTTLGLEQVGIMIQYTGETEVCNYYIQNLIYFLGCCAQFTLQTTSDMSVNDILHRD